MGSGRVQDLARPVGITNVTGDGRMHVVAVAVALGVRRGTVVSADVDDRTAAIGGDLVNAFAVGLPVAVRQEGRRVRGGRGDGEIRVGEVHAGGHGDLHLCRQ